MKKNILIIGFFLNNLGFVLSNYCSDLEDFSLQKFKKNKKRNISKIEEKLERKKNLLIDTNKEETEKKIENPELKEKIKNLDKILSSLKEKKKETWFPQ